MKRTGYLFFFTIFLSIAILAGSCSRNREFAVNLYVSANGNDNNDGSEKSPFATLERARDYIRTLKTKGLSKGGIRVWIADGDYIRTSTFVLEAEDGGTTKCPIVYGGASKRNVRFLGGVRLTDWKSVDAPDLRARLQESVRDEVRQIDLAKAGITDLGSVTAPVDSSQRADLFCNGKYMDLARYPDAGEWLRIADVPMSGAKRYFYDGITHYGRFEYDGSRPSRWKDQSDVWMHGYWVHDWRDEIQRAERIDTIKKKIYPEPPYHHYGYRKGQRYYFLNVFEEMDQLGEWFLDRKTAVLYFLPPRDIASAEVIFPQLRQPMIVLNDTEHVAVEGITFQASRAGGIVVEGGSFNEVRGCDFLNLGKPAVEIKGGTDNGVRSCDVFETAQGGIKISGGDRMTLTPCRNYADNCQIHDIAKIFKTYHPAIRLDGVGSRVSHCYVSDTPHEGIHYEGNDFTIEYCEFTRIAKETGDVGCIYTWADWSYMGHVFRYNYFHHIHAPGHLGCFTVYPDLPCGGIHLYGNVFYETDWVFNTNSGRGMLIENNLIVNSNGFSYKTWPFRDKFEHGSSWQMLERIEAVRYDQPTYTKRYPILKQLAEDLKDTTGFNLIQRRLCKDNLIRSNIFTGPVFLRFTGEVDLTQVVTENNLIASDVPYSYSPQNLFDDWDSYRPNDPNVIEQLKTAGNTIIQGNPGIKAPETGDFSFLKDSEADKFAEKNNFKSIPFEKIGLYADKYRTSN